MLYNHQIQSLNDFQKTVLLYVCNDLFDTKVKVDTQTITSYKKQALAAKLQAAKEKIKPENLEYLVRIGAKLDIDLS